MAEKETGLPKSTLAKIIKERLAGTGVRCSNEARDLIHECCVEFVNMVTQECSSVCDESNRKKMGPEHVMQALKNLEYDDLFIQEVEKALEEHKVAAAKTTERLKKRKSVEPISAEAAAMQNRLLASARDEFEQARQRQKHDSKADVEEGGEEGGEEEEEGEGEDEEDSLDGED